MPQPLRIFHERDPGEQIMEDSAPLLEQFKIRPFDVLLVMYQRELVAGVKKLTSGIFLADNGVGTLREDTYQGKVGIVMKIGTLAFTEAPDQRWDGFVPKVGDWVVINVGDTFSFDLPNKRRARIVGENYVQAIIPQPDLVW